MKKIIFKDSGEIISVISGSEEEISKHNTVDNFIILSEEVSIDMKFDKIIKNKLVKEHHSNKNVLNNLFLDSNNTVENIPENTSLFINDEFYSSITDGFVKVTKDYPEQVVKLTFILWPHKEKVIYA